MEFARVEREGHVLVVTLDRPRVMNALHRAASDELDEVWTRFEADPDLRVAILTGAGDRSFSAGYDMREPPAPGEARSGGFLAHRHPRGLGGLTLRYGMSKPLIAAVNGFALGGGLELALACDVIVAAEHAEFGFPEPRVGRMALEGGMHRLARQLPLKVAMGILLTGRRVSASEAHRMGFVNEVVALADLMPAARRWAAEMLECAPLSLQATKEAVMAGLDLPLPAAIALVPPAMARALVSDDQVEGVNAFREKRPPRWSGR
ncbi:MAG TPA: enoyl-CoA hydratase-related protein [Methylomirabilota bacterium]|jgi:dehydration protein DpgD|nr:enoyl-CoA hydratase-related protein [Methylomirabilota bacterium]